VRFWPDCGGPLIGRAAEGLRDAWLPAEAALGPEGARLRAALAAAGLSAVDAAFDTWVSTRVACAPERDAVVREAVCAIVAQRGELSIAALAREVGLSGRQLLRRFRAATGLTPKEFARVRRLRSVTAGLLAGDAGGWSATAARFGFADQAHLVHEFARMTGLTPTAFRARLAAIEHVRVRP
jgi:AraC-like DNA-binding protein